MKNSKCFFIVLLLVFQYSIAQSNTALDFDGVDDHIVIPHNSTLNLSNFTIEAWVKTTQNIPFARLVTKSVGGSQNYSLCINNGKAHIRFDNGFDANVTESSVNVDDGIWHHIAGVRNSSTNRLEIYVDGVLSNVQIKAGTPMTGTDPVNIGRFSATYSTPTFNGQLDEVRIWNVALSQSDILSRMNTTLIGNETGLVTYYNFEEGVPNGDNSATGGDITQVLDLAGGYHGAVNNFDRIGSASNWVTGITSLIAPNTAMDFDGVDDHILYTNPISGSSKSTTLWVKTTSSSRILLVSGLFISRWAFDGKVYGYFDGSTGNGDNSGNQSATAVNDGNWHHIAATNNGSTTNLYIDGVLEASYADSYSQFTPERIGGNHSANEDWLDGQVDEYATWNKALTQKEIVALMNHKLTGNEPDLAVYYDFEEGVPIGDNSATGGNITQVIDQAGSNNGSVNNFTRTGTASNWVNGKTFSKENTALDFDGGNDYIDMGTSIGTGLRTIEMWFKPNATIDNSNSGYISLITRNDASQADEFTLFFNSIAPNQGKLTFGRNASGTGGIFINSNGNTWNAGTWYHVVGVFDPVDGIALYIDGVKQTETNPDTGAPGARPEITALGRWGDLAIRHFNGQMDEVRLWNRALTQAEIQCQMNAPLTGTENGLIAYYDFEEGVEYGDNSSLTTVFDKAGTNHGTVNGFAKTGVSSNWVLGTVLSEPNCIPIVSLSGNGQNIPCNATPMLSNHTDFGKTDGFSTVNRTFTITNTGHSPLTLPTTGWANVGANGFSDGAVGDIDLAIDDNGVQYVVFTDASISSRATVMKNDGSGWAVVGAKGISISVASDNSIAIDENNTPYIAYAEFAGGTNKAYVKKFDGSTWIDVGTPGFTPGSAFFTSLVINSDGEPVLAFQDGSNSNNPAVAKFDGSSWTSISTGLPSADVENLELVKDGANLYLSFKQTSTSNARVYKYDAASGTWSQFGTNLTDVNNVLRMAIHNGTPYLVYASATGSNEVTVKFFNGTIWETAGGTTLDNLGSEFDIASNGYDWYVVYRNVSGGKALCQKLSGGSWSYVGPSSGSGTGFNTGATNSNYALEIDACGLPIVAFADNSVGDKTVVWKYETAVNVAGDQFTETASPSATTLNPGESTTFSVQFDPTKTGNGKGKVFISSNDPEKSCFAFEVQGGTNTALDFDGVDDYVKISDNGSVDFNFEERTIEAWVKADVVNKDLVIFSQDYTTHIPPYYSFHLRISSPGWIFWGWNHNSTWNFGNYIRTPDNTIIPGQWYHIAVVYKKGQQQIFIDGFLIASASNFDNVDLYNQEVYIGKMDNPNSEFNGQIDEVRIWNRALCQQEIFLRKDIPLQGNENGLVAYYDFEDGVPNANNTAITEVKDKAGTNHGTPTNFDLGATAPGTSSNFVGGTALTSIPPVAGVPITWLGTTSDWNTASNWSTTSIPDQCSEVLIPVTANDPLLSSNAAVNGIEIEEGATLTLQPGGCLWVGSTFTNNGNFILQANSSNYAQYQGPQVYGTMQQTIANAGWHTIASPFIDATLGDINFDQNAFLQFGALDKCNIQYYEGGEFQSSPADTWANAWGSWLCAANENEPFDGSRAYNLYLDDVFFADVFPVTMSVSGTLRNMPITQQFNGANGGWNNASNPFPSVLDFEKWQDNSAINNTYYVWDASTNNYNTYMAGGTGVPANMTQYIAPYQSVFVKTSNGTTTPAPAADEPDVWQDHLTSNADRPTECPSTINPFFKTELTGMLRLQTTTGDKQYSDETVLRFGNGYSKGFGIEEEADKFFSPEEEIPSLYTLVEDRPYVISSFPQPQNVVQHIPLGMATETVQDIIITATEIPEGVTAILEDKEKGVFHNLKSPYTFKTNIAQDNTRFVLHVGDKNLNENQLTTDDDLIAFVREGELVFYYNEELFGGEMRLINMAGQIVEKAKVEEGGRIDVSRLNTGLYVVMVTNGDKFYSQKIVVH